MNRPRLLLADDHPETRALLRTLLEGDFDIVEEVEDGLDLVNAADRLLPDVIVTDVAMPGVDGIEAAIRIRGKNPAARIVFVSMHTDPGLVDRGLATGALAYVPKLAAGDDLVPAVQAALRGERHAGGIRGSRNRTPR